MLIGPGKIEAQGKSYYYKEKRLSLTSKELKKYKGKVCFAISEESCKKLPGVTCDYAAQAPCVRVKSQNHVVTVFANERKIYVDSQKVTLSISPKEVRKKKKRMMLVPFEELLQALSIECSWNKSCTKCVLKKKKVSYEGQNVHTTYSYTFGTYAKKEYQKNYQASLSTYKRLLTPSKDNTWQFQFLRLNTYRQVNKNVYLGYYNNEIEIYCRINKINKKKSVLYGKGKQLLAAAKKYNIDPLYFTCQTFVESAYGTSVLAKGKKIGKKKYYNLYGIKAYDNNPLKNGFRYARKKGWNTIQKALNGAAWYLSSGYIHSKYKQNTLFKIRFTPKKAIWHQYASDPYYAEKIGKKMKEISICYAKDNRYLYDYPRYR